MSINFDRDLNFVYPDGTHFKVEFLKPKKFPTKRIEMDIVVMHRGADFETNKLLVQRDLRTAMSKITKITSTKCEEIK